MTVVVAPVARVHRHRRLGRREITGVVYGILGIVVVALVAPNISGQTRAFAFEPPPNASKTSFDPPTLAIVIGLIYVAVGVFSIAGSRFARAVTWSQIGAAFAFPVLVLGVALTQSNAGETNVTNLVVESLVLATPIALGAMTGLWCERSGIVNIGIEGQMLTGAGVGFMVYAVFGSAQSTGWRWMAVVAAILTGAILGLLHAWLTVSLHINQIVSGVVINLFALGFTGFLRSEVIVPQGISTGTPTGSFGIPLLEKIPVIGGQLFRGQPIHFVMFFVVALTWYVMFRTPWGLRVRACGENPHAAETLGIDVIATRYRAVVLGGMIAGLAGAWFSLEAQSRFEDNMTNFTGFIALAAMIFGKWRPWPAFAGAALFGFARALGARMQILGVEVGGFEIPSNFWQMLPFVVTIIVVAGAVGRAAAPAAEGVPYRRSR